MELLNFRVLDQHARDLTQIPFRRRTRGLHSNLSMPKIWSVQQHHKSNGLFDDKIFLRFFRLHFESIAEKKTEREKILLLVTNNEWRVI